MGLRHQIPSEFTDEDRWFKFFTKTTLKYLIAGLVITYLLFKLFGLIGFSLIGVTIGLVITIGLVFIASYPIPETQYINCLLYTSKSEPRVLFRMAYLLPKAIFLQVLHKKQGLMRMIWKYYGVQFVK